MTLTNLVTIADLSDPVNFTFFLGTMAMTAASAFFFLSLNLPKKNHTMICKQVVYICRKMIFNILGDNQPLHHEINAEKHGKNKDPKIQRQEPLIVLAN